MGQAAWCGKLTIRCRSAQVILARTPHSSAIAKYTSIALPRMHRAVLDIKSKHGMLRFAPDCKSAAAEDHEAKNFS